MNDGLIVAILLCSTIHTALVARNAVAEAFWYKKSKSAIRKHNKEILLIYRILRAYTSATPTHAPFHMKLFQYVRLCNYVGLVIAGVLIGLFPEQLALFVGIKLFLIDLPVWGYSLVLTQWKYDSNARVPYGRINYDKARRP
ncbi:MAG: hypothetical protein E7457_02765 [Ruminococcaceae bacterium]|nr:hypothetical protein [Oscillospiraceae bacterium]